MLKAIWNFFVDLRTSFWLLLFTSLTLIIGAYSIKFFFSVFDPLNDMLLQQWYARYGSMHWELIWWLPLLFLLLFLLGINTFCCTLKRLLILFSKRKKFFLRNFTLKLSPSMIHFCFLAIIIGHLLSEVGGVNQVFKVVPGKTVNIANIEASVMEKTLNYYDHPESLQNNLKSCALKLELRQGNEKASKIVGFLEPVSFAGHTFNLVKIPQKGDDKPFKLQVRQDPGLPIITAGFIVMMSFLLWYFIHITVRNFPVPTEEENGREMRSEMRSPIIGE